MIVPQSTGELRKILNASNGLNPFTFPVGTTTGGNEYTPVQLDFLSATFGANAYVGVRVQDQRATTMNTSITSYINRNWIVEPSNISNYNYEIQLNYVQADYVGIAGDEGGLKPIKYSMVNGSGQWYQSDVQDFSNAIVQGTSFVNSTSNVIIWGGLTTFSEFGGAVGSNQPLPVELLNFSAQCEENHVELVWQTASEFNSSHFDLEKSRDGISWEKLAQIPAAGNSNDLLSYSYFDTNPLSQQYYRLHQFDIDGKDELFAPIAISCTENSSSYFTSYPNPSHEAFNVVIQDKDFLGYCNLIIRDNNGKQVYLESIEVKDGLNLFVINKSLVSGIYFLEIINSDSQKTTSKHVVK
jgi:hypothetical protein